MQRSRYYILFLLWFIFLYSCSLIHEEPGEDGVDPTLVDVYMTFILPEDTAIQDDHSDETSMDTRYTFEVTPKIMKMKSDTTRQTVFITSSPLANGDTLTFPVKISPAQNNIRVWIDYVPRGNSCECYYNTNHLSSVKVTEPYQVCTNQKRAFAGNHDIDLSNFEGQEYAKTSTTINLTLPFGSFSILSTDYQQYVQDHPNDAPITTIIKYRNYYPCGYNVSNQCANLNDFRTNIDFTSEAIALPDNSGIIAHDHVFVSPDPSDIAVDLFFYSASGNLIQKVKNIQIPIRRGELTTISDDFLTQEFEDPDENNGTTVE